MTSERFQADDGWVMYRRPTRLEPTVLCKRCNVSALAGWVFLGQVPLTIEHTLVCASCGDKAIAHPSAFARALSEYRPSDAPDEVARLRGWLEWRKSNGRISYAIEPRFLPEVPMAPVSPYGDDGKMEVIPWWEAALIGMQPPCRAVKPAAAGGGA